MEFYIEHIKITLTQEDNCVWIDLGDGKSLFGKIDLHLARKLIVGNCTFICNHYKTCSPSFIHLEDFESHLTEVSLQIALRYLFMYVDWKNNHENYKNQALEFNPKDFEHPYTKDTLISFFKNKYPKEYHAICACLLNKTAAEIATYESERDYFYSLYK